MLGLYLIDLWLFQQVKEQLRAGLSTLPTPRNDYEIVVPEDEAETDNKQAAYQIRSEDQADVDQRAYDTMKAKSKCYSLFLRNISLNLLVSSKAHIVMMKSIESNQITLDYQSIIY